MAEAGGTPVAEGYIDFDYAPAGKPLKTYYRVVGDVRASRRRPLVVLHGGPGVAMDYMFPHDDLHRTHGIPVIYFQQFGSGRSTLIPEKASDAGFWRDEAWFADIDNAIAKLLPAPDSPFDLLGQSWGGMIAAAYVATRQPRGLRRLVIANSPVSGQAWADGGRELMKRLPEDVRETIERCEARAEFETDEYESACMAFYQEFLCKAKPWPDELTRSLESVKADPTVYYTMQGPSEFTIVGKLKDWTCIHHLDKIGVPTLVLNGRDDPARDEGVRPFADRIKDSRWVTFDKSSHMPQWEEREAYIALVGDFLALD